MSVQEINRRLYRYQGPITEVRIKWEKGATALTADSTASNGAHTLESVFEKWEDVIDKTEDPRMGRVSTKRLTYIDWNVAPNSAVVTGLKWSKVDSQEWKLVPTKSTRAQIFSCDDEKPTSTALTGKQRQQPCKKRSKRVTWQARAPRD